MSDNMQTLADAKVGQRVQFAYYGGSNIGDLRLVDVQEVFSDRIVGLDVCKDKIRHYLFAKAEMVSLVEPEPAEAACDAIVEPKATTRMHSHPISFPDARDLLHDQIDALNGDDLAEVLAEINGDDHGRFDATSGVVVLERQVLIPHCKVNMHAHQGAAGVDWINEGGNILTTTFFNTDTKLVLFVGDNEVTAEELITSLSQHLGLTIA